MPILQSATVPPDILIVASVVTTWSRPTHLATLVVTARCANETFIVCSGMLKWTRHRQHAAQFIVAAAIIIAMVLSWYGLNGIVFLLATCLLLLVSIVREIRHLRDSIPAANVLTSVVANQPLFTYLRQITDACSAAVKIQDKLHRDLCLEQIQTAANDVSNAAAGDFDFESTERWRTYYERLLTSPGLHVYRSVAVVRKPSYWQTEAGLKGIQLNHQLSESKRLTIERVVVLTNELWPDRNVLPVEKIQEWLIEQHHHGISLYLAREFELSGEADLLVDMGIYGSRAVGIQELDDHGNTRRFTLQFDMEHVQQAEERWQRLLVYAVKYSDFLDRYTITS